MEDLFGGLFGALFGAWLMVGNTVESLKNALSELDGSPGTGVGGERKRVDSMRVEKSSIPTRRHMSVNLR